MPFPTAYDEDGLKQFILVCLSATATALGWTTSTAEIDEAFNETLLSLDLSDAADATDIRLLRATARVEAWRSASEALASRFDAETDSEKFALEKLHEHALKQLADARLALSNLPDSSGGTSSSSTPSRSGAAVNRAVW